MVRIIEVKVSTGWQLLPSHVTEKWQPPAPPHVMVAIVWPGYLMQPASHVAM